MMPAYEIHWRLYYLGLIGSIVVGLIIIGLCVLAGYESCSSLLLGMLPGLIFIGLCRSKEQIDEIPEPTPPSYAGKIPSNVRRWTRRRLGLTYPWNKR